MADDQDLLDLLPNAVMRVEVAGAISGSGFVVAPGFVLTCHHVVKPALADPHLITVVDTSRPDAPAEHLVAAPQVDETNDLALLTTAPRTEPAVVLLGESYQVDDALATYGYTAEKPHGTPGTYEVEGIESGPPRLIKFKSGVVQHGMSGAPVLNRRTGMICGVLKRTRDKDAATGGLAIPIDIALKVFPRLRLLNNSAGQTDARWRQRMSAHQQVFLQKFLRVLASTSSAAEIIVTIGQESDRWTVLTEAVPPEGDDWGSKKLVDLNVLRRDVARLLRLLRARDRLKPVEQSKLLGAVLAKTIWNEEAQQRLVEMLRQPTANLNVSLLIDDAVDEDLKYLPWEQLALPDGPNMIRLASHERSTMTRVRGAGIEHTDGVAPLRVTLVVAPGEVGYEKQVRRFGDNLYELLKSSQRKIVRLPSPSYPRSTVPALANVTGASPTDIVHYIGFGLYQDGYDAIQLDGSPEDRFEYLDAEDFAVCLKGPPPPRLVVLQPYKVSETEVPVDFTTLAPALFEIGVEAVLAFPLPVDPEASLVFFKNFYAQVMAGTSLRAAVQAGRLQLESLRRPWAFPALIASRPGDLHLASAQSTASAQLTGPAVKS
jgi:hypothetical protein